MKKVLATEKAPAAIGPYSQGVRGGDYVFISGQLPINPATGEFAGEDIVSQTKQSLTNIKSILESEGLSMANVVKTTVLLKNISEFGAMNEVYASFFEGECPARAAYEVAALPKNALVEIEAIAYCGK
ncbi:MAG: RidA family protein [Lacrimispora sphenoides]|uniref:2-iminobutanoate/2-iminopropanoate deaminase n=1 Tax=Lacrimispora sphenoides JCM 1415 TaxID=1297793 RepID=A0ABY1C4P6_9FIRM|nr:RidA family protein [Lacrimispora sphenoides]SET65729.1 2-iminobutanoate/2-iminopropanoate deaminase [[Clostridium] sphenoides JCM 1415]SUY50304.1 endoribonuclease L-PSP [Lacrimispora sphenoides]